MSKIYEVRSITHDDRPHYWGARHTYEEAQQVLDSRFGDDHQEWAEKYHRRWWIEEIDTTDMFRFPAAPMPRKQYSARSIEFEDGKESKLKVEVLNETGEVVTHYTRNYGGLMQTFEPFRQGDKMFALISTDYTATSVLDLTTGRIIASETPHSNGFCPVGFYVPDWWDLHDGSILPGSFRWNDDLEHPKGNFGFVWGCIWGDDSSWKVQYLDLSKIQNGQITRDDRFGYLKLASDHDVDPKEFINCHFHRGKYNVEFRTLKTFDLESGTELSELD